MVKTFIFRNSIATTGTFLLKEPGRISILPMEEHQNPSKKLSKTDMETWVQQTAAKKRRLCFLEANYQPKAIEILYSLLFALLW